MKERDVKSRTRVKASEVHAHQTVELNGQRLRVDRRGRTRGGKIKLQQIHEGTRGVRTLLLTPTKKLDLILR